MRFKTLAIVAALSAGFAPHKGAEPPVVTANRAPRTHRDVRWVAPRGALAALPSWRVMWDRDTDVPLRLWGPAIPAPGTASDAALAEATARQLLASHLATLAPGAAVADFALLANTVDRAGLRTVSFAQHRDGLAVVGGAIAFTFSHDKLTMMSSTALPHVSVRLPGGALPPHAIASAARRWLGNAGYAVEIKAHGERVIVPIVRTRGTRATPDIELRVAETVEVESTREAGAWQVWIDAATGGPIARRSTLHFASGTVLYDTPDRYPGGARSAKPAAGVTHTIDATPVTGGLDGSITWAGDASVSVTAGLAGPLVKVTNKAGALATDALALAPGGTVTWSKAADEYADAQLTAFIAAGAAKQFAKTHLDASLPWLDGQIPVVVNEQQTCNAYSTGNAIHFYKAKPADLGGGLSSNQCENTARLPDVVYHEFGHSLHRQSIIPGQGAWDGALSEGLADTLAQAITGDPAMGRGFFMSDAPLRDLNPDGYEKRWPDDVTGEVHDDGEIIGGTLWDLRVALEAKLGQEAGYREFLTIFYGIMQRATDIPSSYAEALVADDDDGDLANGTPNLCTIEAVFGAHGLADATVLLGIEPPVRDGNKVSITARASEAELECPAPVVASGTLSWRPAGGEAETVSLASAGDSWSGNIPTQPDGTVVLYTITLALSDGSSITYPQNRADREYQFYSGAVETLWCADFESGLGGWTVGASSPNRLEWEAGAPMGIGGDPLAAHGGNNVLGIDLGGDDGFYRSRTRQWAVSPDIDLQGHTNVRLHYYRWLHVEDGQYDQATISANGTVVWTNHASTSMFGGATHHTDGEWRFHDVDLAAHTAGGKLSLEFALDSDEGLELAGWNVDDVCLVIAGPPAGACGNHNVDEGETCDDGNTEDGDACPSDCGESAAGGGCCSAGGHPAGPLALSLLTLGLVLRRRRRG